MSENILPSQSSPSLLPPPTHGAPPPPPPPRVQVPAIPVAPQPPPRFGKSNMSEEMNIQRPPGSKLERLGANAPPKVPEKEKTLILKPKKIHLIDPRKAINTEIMLTSVKLSPTDIVNAVLAMDNTHLDFDQVENILKFFPTKEEMEQLRNYKGDMENLGKCEQYFFKLMKVPRIETKLNIFLYKFQFHSMLAGLKKSLNIVNSLLEEIKQCVKLKEVMKRILYLGNTLNQGTSRGSAVGFKLDSLLKLNDTRSKSTRMTLVHYLCKLLVNKAPHLLDFPKELDSLEAAKKIHLKTLAEEMQALTIGLRKAKQELDACAKDGPIFEGFHTTLKEFIGHNEKEVESVQNLYNVVGKSADGLALYFGEDPKKCPFEQAIQVISNFVRLFIKCHKENLKYAELEREESQEGDENSVVLPATGCSPNPSLILV